MKNSINIGSTIGLCTASMFASLCGFLCGFLCRDLGAQGGLPPPPVPAANPITQQKAILGKILFWDEQLSSNNRFACGSCHFTEFGGAEPTPMRHPGFDNVFNTADDTFGSPGVVRADAQNEFLPSPAFGSLQQVTRRAAPTFLVSAWFPELFWDGRAGDTFVDPQTGAVSLQTSGGLESQAVGPPMSPAEMAHDQRQWSEVLGKLPFVRPLHLATNIPPDMAAAISQHATYPQLFANAFGDPAITVERIAFAIATYERTLVPDQTPWDQFQRGVMGAMNMQQMRGMMLFNGPARCNLCHPAPLFSDRQFRNLGLRPIVEDIGRQAVTNNLADRGKFKTPSLRNSGLRTSFMHTGEMSSLAQVMSFYISGGGNHLDNKDPLMVPLTLAPRDVNDVIAFVGTALTDLRVARGMYPFDRPTLLRERMPADGWLYGFGTPGSSGIVPRMLAEVPANIGNVDFRVAIGDALGGTFAALLVADKFAPPGMQVQGTFVHVDLTDPIVFTRILNGPTVAGQGFATVKSVLPRDPLLVGTSLFAQWFVFEPALPSVASSSQGAELRFF